MKKYLVILFFGLVSVLYSNDVLIKNDNGNPTSATPARAGWEETVFLVPDGPCKVKSILIYFNGKTAGKDTIYVVGDPSEGTVAPTGWCLPYNMRIPPIIINYDGVPGWDTINVSGLNSDGLDRIVIQHTLKASGPWFANDNDGAVNPLKSWIMNPKENNSLGGPGNYYRADGDYLVRLIVEYTYPKNNSSAPPPPPAMVNVSIDAGLVNSSNATIGASEVSVADWNNDGWDDVAIGGNFFQNNADGTFKNVTAQIGIQAGLTSWGDYNNDGLIDCFALNNGAYDDDTKTMSSTSKIYKNNGNGTFTAIDSKKSFNLPYPSPLVDYHVSSQTQENIFNPYPCITPLWLDYNKDGRLDMFFANNRVGLTDKSGNYAERYFPDELWMQNADTTFTLTTKTSKIDAAEPFNPDGNWYGYYDCYGASACDYNRDNMPDIFVANYRLVKDNLLKNNSNGTFTDVAASTGTQGVTTPSGYANYFGHGMGLEWADFNNDGYPDLCVGNLGHPDWRASFSNPSLIFKNNGPGSNYNFTEVHDSMGLKFFEMNAGVLWGDFDLDGYQDLWHGQISYNAESASEPKRSGHYYMNQGPPDYKLKDATWEINAKVHGPWSAARLDYDHDGDLDILVCSNFEGVKLFRNDMVRKGNWLAIRLIGNPAEQVGMSAYGSNAIVYSGGKIFYRDLMGSMSGTRCNQNSSELHFGLGNISSIDSLVITYPNAKRNVITNIEVNNRYTIAYMQAPSKGKIATPALVYPAHLQAKVALSENLQWTASAGCSYQLQVFDDYIGKTPVIDQKNLTNPQFAIATLQDHHYYSWKVRAFKGTDTTIWTSPRAFNVGLPLPSVPALLQPINDSLNAPAKAQFTWSPVTYNSLCSAVTTYKIQISETNDFATTSVDSSAIVDTKFTITNALKPGTKYYWRVRAFNDTEAGDWSVVRSFTVMALAMAPALKEPADNATKVELKPTFLWDAATNASTYAIQISSASDFSDIFYEKSGLSKVSNKFLKAFKGSTKYYWHVRSENAGGAGAWSATYNFTTMVDTDVDDVLPEGYMIYDALPNPANDETSLRFAIPTPCNVEINVFNSNGEKEFDVCNKYFESGENSIIISTKSLASGAYYIRVLAGNYTMTRKIVVVR
jgi:hypothetical protein